MISRQAVICLASISLMICTAGCYSHSPYGYGGYPGNMGGYPPQGGMMQPQGNFTPNVVPDSTYQQQGSPTLAPQEDNWGSSGGGNDAPSFNNNEADPGSSGGVPEYPNNDGSEFDSSSNPGFNGDIDAPEDSGDDYFDKNGSIDPQSGVEQVLFESDEFQEPRKLQPIPGATLVKKQEVTPFASSSSVFGYDKVEYSWLRGVVDYDSENKAWHIMYNLRPGSSDQFGGEFAMTKHAGLSKLKNGDVVLVKGYVDDSDRDAYGKVIYRVEELVPLKKK